MERKVAGERPEVGAAGERDAYEAARRTLLAIFAPDGPLGRLLPGYERRSEQVELAEAVLEHLFAGRPLLAEAPTGTGKSLAYLVAAAIYAVQSGELVVVSTQTLTLQGQLIGKDLPLVARALQAAGVEDFRYALAKGRSHYVCLRRLDRFVERAGREGGALQAAAERLRSAVLAALAAGGEGERRTLGVSVPPDVWAEVAGDAEDCHQKRSPHYDRCFIQQARRAWGRVHLLVANHALVFADLALRAAGESAVLPKYGRLVLDEGHRVPEAAMRYFAASVSIERVEGWFREIERRRQSWMEDVFSAAVLEEVRGHFDRLVAALEHVFLALEAALFPPSPSPSGFSGGSPVSAGERPAERPAVFGEARPIEGPIAVPRGDRAAAEALLQYLDRLQAAEGWEEPTIRGLRRLKEKIAGVVALLDRATEAADGTTAFWVERTMPPGAAWIDGAIPSARARWLSLHGEPIDAREILAPFFQEVPPVIVSATLFPDGRNEADRRAVADAFGLGASATALVLPSPFDTASQMLYVFSRSGPDPREEGAYLAYVARALKQVLEKTGGRTLALFTNFAHIRAVGEMLRPWAEGEGIDLLLHTPEADREALVARFRATPRAVLFGNETFWEGIDLPGDGLVCVVVTKLPFANPADPRVRARERALRRSGQDPFTAFFLPEALLRLRQGIGRLIRTKDDRGAVVFLDGRLLTKRYGRRMIAALPPARVGSLDALRAYVPSQTAVTPERQGAESTTGDPSEGR
ncbi:MAG: DinG family ATP-dependent helicase YoaA [Hydrogenibacillus schlegelii]|uniref:DinG family ATP-dependent helicase YoaA n=1 Tax=Hydrogenibacillus schlegelii TaxID=1484 RepID=A0A2T5GDY8_HYDSH|nr:ATP-dependent DNA helicase [Hydrogenibacillus schlegelii]PTQ54396.1 MAG: DinG family ATP-dependent helicase YoaA [Hydrogenibacillus schlegelii]